VEHEAQLNRIEMSMLRQMCGFNLKYNKEIQRFGNYWDGNQSACQLTGVDYSGL